MGQTEGLGIQKGRFYILETKSHPTERGVVRDPMAFKVRPTGLATSNVNGAGAVFQLAKDLGLDPERFGIKLGGDEAEGQVALWAVSPTAPGATGFGYNTDTKTMSLYMHDLFQAKPALRPDGVRWCSMQRGLDDEGAQCLIISLRVTPILRKGGPRGKHAGGPKAGEPGT